MWSSAGELEGQQGQLLITFKEIRLELSSELN